MSLLRLCFALIPNVLSAKQRDARGGTRYSFALIPNVLSAKLAFDQPGRLMALP